ncbi:MAG: hypothetical protein K2X27_23375 [Candidatus Obscuribacterales bacterium]|nr:hypothetical protein [Candidatus Obscuribacterales bacterium]
MPKAMLAILLLGQVLISGGVAMATETRNTSGEQAKVLSESLKKHILQASASDGKAKLVSDGHYTKAQQKEFFLAVSESFDGPPDRHSSTKFSLKSILPTALKLGYESRFDHNSFGKDLVTIETGEIDLLLTKSK